MISPAAGGRLSTGAMPVLDGRTLPSACGRHPCDLHRHSRGLPHSNQEEWRECSDRPIRAIGCLGVSPGIVICESDAKHCVVIKGIARTLDHGAFEIGNRFIGPAIPGTQETSENCRRAHSWGLQEWRARSFRRRLRPLKSASHAWLIRDSDIFRARS